MPCEVGRPSACEATVVHEIQVGSAVQQQTIESTSPGTEPESVLLYSTNDTVGSNKLCVGLDWANLVTELFRSRVERNARKIFKLHYYNKFDIETFRGRLNSVTSSSELGEEPPDNCLKAMKY